jgi:hypothetical protein
MIERDKRSQQHEETKARIEARLKSKSCQAKRETAAMTGTLNGD